MQTAIPGEICSAFSLEVEGDFEHHLLAVCHLAVVVQFMLSWCLNLSFKTETVP